MSTQQLEKVSIIPERENLPAVMTPMAMLEKAVSNNSSMEVVEKLMALQERWEAHQARKAFDEAMASAQGEMPVLTKNRLVSYPSQKSPTGFVTYRHEDLAEIIETIKPVLKKFGLAHRFRTTQDGDKITVTCVITGHGHREENSLSAGRDTSGGKNNHQEIASAVTYLERYTLKAALGLAASNDDDGATAEGKPVAITQDQADQLVELLEANGKERSKFLRWAKVDRVEDIPAAYFKSCVDAITGTVARS